MPEFVLTKRFAESTSLSDEEMQAALKRKNRWIKFKNFLKGAAGLAGGLGALYGLSKLNNGGYLEGVKESLNNGLSRFQGAAEYLTSGKSPSGDSPQKPDGKTANSKANNDTNAVTAPKTNKSEKGVSPVINPTATPKPEVVNAPSQPNSPELKKFMDVYYAGCDTKNSNKLMELKVKLEFMLPSITNAADRSRAESYINSLQEKINNINSTISGIKSADQQYIAENAQYKNNMANSFNNYVSNLFTPKVFQNAVAPTVPTPIKPEGPISQPVRGELSDYEKTVASVNGMKRNLGTTWEQDREADQKAINDALIARDKAAAKARQEYLNDWSNNWWDPALHANLWTKVGQGLKKTDWTDPVNYIPFGYKLRQPTVNPNVAKAIATGGQVAAVANKVK